MAIHQPTYFVGVPVSLLLISLSTFIQSIYQCSYAPIANWACSSSSSVIKITLPNWHCRDDSYGYRYIALPCCHLLAGAQPSPLELLFVVRCLIKREEEFHVPQSPSFTPGTRSHTCLLNLWAVSNHVPTISRNHPDSQATHTHNHAPDIDSNRRPLLTNTAINSLA